MNFQIQYQFARRRKNDRINEWQRFIIKGKEGFGENNCTAERQALFSIGWAF
jgi:hypothetical protein